MTYRDYVFKNILDPISMNETNINLSDGNGSESTVDDLLKFSNALRKHKLIEKEQFSRMIRKQSEADYGLGFKLSFEDNKKIYKHTGGSWEDQSPMGIASSLDIVNDTFTIIILTNRNPQIGGSQARRYVLDQINN